ncbi:MAG TPA: hypothetical protein VFJ14_01005 [Nocardioidaceae bacterium]|nr:hypothetical protein [Nocardioidaceae bacterium]
MKQRKGLYEAAGQRRGEQRFLIVLGLVGLAMALLLGAFFAGRAISDGTDSGAADRTAPQQRAERSADVDADSLAEAAVGGVDPRERARTPKGQSGHHTGRLTGKPYRGPRSAITPEVARASCRSADSVEAGGRKVSYAAMNTIDGRRVSAWRCDGNGRGETIRFRLDGKRTIVAVGLVPGYARTAANGTDLYDQHRRIKRARWTFDGGRFVVQRFNHRPDNRSLQKLRIPPVKTRTITLKILASTRASRDAVAISTAWFAAAR